MHAWSVPASPWEFEVLGEGGSCRSLCNGAEVQLRITGDGGRYDWSVVAVPPVTPRSTVVCCLEDLVEAHESGGTTRNHIDVAHRTTEACLAVAESHRRDGAWVGLPIENRDLYVFHV